MGHKLLKGLIAGLRGREARRVECAEEIALLCHDLGTCKQIVALGGVQALVENLKGTNVSAREAAMGALANLGRDNEAASVVRLSGGINVLVRLVVEGATPSEKEYSAAALGAIAANTLCCSAICNAGGVPALVHLLKTATTSAQREWAAAALGVLTNCTRSTQDALREAGGIQPLLNVLIDRQTDGERALAAAAIGLMAFGNEQNQLALLEAGAIPLLVAASNDKEPRVRSEATFALKSVGQDNLQVQEVVAELMMKQLLEEDKCLKAPTRRRSKPKRAPSQQRSATTTASSTSVMQEASVQSVRRLHVTWQSMARVWSGLLWFICLGTAMCRSVLHSAVHVDNLIRQMVSHSATCINSSIKGVSNRLHMSIQDVSNWLHHVADLKRRYSPLHGKQSVLPDVEPQPKVFAGKDRGTVRVDSAVLDDFSALCVCPISHELMTDPVICCDGHSYERASIEKWFEDHDSSPLTNAELENKDLIPNHVLRAMCERQATLHSSPSI